MLGSLVAVLMANLLPPAAATDRPVPRPPAPGWRSLLGPNWLMLKHGLCSGLAVALVPVVWQVLALPDLSQMGISIVAAMGVPALTGEPQRDRRAITERTSG